MLFFNDRFSSVLVRTLPQLRASAGVLAIAVTLVACDESTPGPDNSIPTAAAVNTDTEVPAGEAGSQQDVFFDAGAAETSSIALELQRRVLNSARAALDGLNSDYVAGTLAAERLDCISGDFPVMAYYCGDEGYGKPLSDYGSSIASFSFVNEESCRNALVAGSGAKGCVVDFADVRYPEGWSVRYRLRLVDGNPVATLNVANGATEVAVDPSQGNALCAVTINGIDAPALSYSDEAGCDRSMRAVFAVDDNAV